MAALTTLAKVKQYGKITSFEDDLLLLRLIDAASSTVEKFCSREFASASRVEVRDGTGTRKMMLRHFPVTAVASLTINGRVIPPRPSPLASGYTHDDECIKLTGYAFDDGVDNVEVVYTGGLETVPADVDAAVCEMVCTRYQGTDRLGIKSKGLAGETIVFDVDDIPDHLGRVLNQYQMVALP
jgi:hypothetical protein